MSEHRPVTREQTLHVYERCLCLHVQRAARALARRFDDAFRPLGITSGQFSLMMALNVPEPPAMGVVAERLAMDRTTLTAALKPLERRKLVRVRPDPRDRRRRVLRLTPSGQRLLTEALPLWKRAHAQVDELLAEGEPEQVRSHLRALL
ncbi:MAG: MarR family winged helix-turn-helix transcriptional regulator [Myxococcota bacterium]